MRTHATTPVVETYDDVERLLRHVCVQFMRRNGGHLGTAGDGSEFDDAMSEARIAYMRAYQTWQPDGGSKFTTYLCQCVYRRLLDRYKFDRRRRALWQGVADPDTLGVPDRLPFDRDSFERHLTEDAQVVLSLVLDAPDEIAQIAMNKGGQPQNWRSTIRDYLAAMGWAARRITRTFDEIKEAL